MHVDQVSVQSVIQLFRAKPAIFLFEISSLTASLIESRKELTDMESGGIFWEDWDHLGDLRYCCWSFQNDDESALRGLLLTTTRQMSFYHHGSLILLLIKVKNCKSVLMLPIPLQARWPLEKPAKLLELH